MASKRSRGGYTYDVDEKGNIVSGTAVSNADIPKDTRSRDGATWTVNKYGDAINPALLDKGNNDEYGLNENTPESIRYAVMQGRANATKSGTPSAEVVGKEVANDTASLGESALETSEKEKEDTDDKKVEKVTKTYSFTPSQTYLDAMKYTQSLLDKLNTGRTSYTDKLEDIMAQINGREAFSYDFNTDTMFQQQLQSAMASGKLAMQDTMGQASALTGGYGNTYAQSVGNQAYNQQIQGAYDNLPEFYGMALDAYNAEGNALAQRYAMYQTADESEYNRLANAYANNLQKTANIYDQEYNNYWQGVQAEQQAAQSILENQQFYDKLAAQYGVGFNSDGSAYKIDGTVSYAEPTTPQYDKLLKAYNTSPDDFYRVLDSMPSDIDVDKVMEYVTEHGNKDMSLAYKDWENSKDTFNWFGGIDNNDKVTITNADGTQTTMTLNELYKALKKAGMSDEAAKEYVMRYNGNK